MPTRGVKTTHYPRCVNSYFDRNKIRVASSRLEHVSQTNAEGCGEGVQRGEMNAGCGRSPPMQNAEVECGIRKFTPMQNAEEECGIREKRGEASWRWVPGAELSGEDGEAVSGCRIHLASP